MSLFDWFSSEESNVSVGEQVLKSYYNEAIKFPEFGFSSYEAWINSIKSKIPDYVELVGDLVIMNYASTSLEDSMDRAAQLANQSGGQASTQEIVMAAGGRGDTVNWSAGIPEITSGAAETLTDTFENIGEGVLATGNMLKYLPWILGAAGALYVYTWAKSSGGAMGGSVGQGIKSLADAGAERIRGRK